MESIRAQACSICKTRPIWNYNLFSVLFQEIPSQCTSLQSPNMVYYVQCTRYETKQLLLLFYLIYLFRGEERGEGGLRFDFFINTNCLRFGCNNNIHIDFIFGSHPTNLEFWISISWINIMQKCSIVWPISQTVSVVQLHSLYFYNNIDW